MKHLIVIFILVASINIFALRLTPMAGYLQPSGYHSVFNFTAINTTSVPEAVQVFIEYRNKDDSKLYKKPASDFFKIYPSKMILFPEQSGKANKKNIKIMWTGGKVKDHERSFRLIVEQVPLNFSKRKVNGGKMQIVPRYIASVYVAPQDFQSSVKIMSKKVISNNLVVDFQNDGKKHHLFKDILIKVKSKGKTRTLTKQDLKGIYLHSVLAKSRKRFVLKLPKDLPVNKLKASDIEIQI